LTLNRLGDAIPLHPLHYTTAVSTKKLIAPQNYREPTAMHWKIYSDNVSRFLASDQQSSYSLKILTEHLKIDHVHFIAQLKHCFSIS
jgi:hypothetical protein